MNVFQSFTPSTLKYDGVDKKIKLSMNCSIKYLLIFLQQFCGTFKHVNVLIRLLSPLSVSLLLRLCGKVKNSSHFICVVTFLQATCSSTFCDIHVISFTLSIFHS
jgi:hypothetical protein